jgi:hypothetical protein
MVAYPAVSPLSLDSIEAELALLAHVQRRRHGESVADIAARHGRSRSGVYAAVARANRLLAPQRRGPKVEGVELKRLRRELAASRARVEVLEAERAAWRAREEQSVIVDDRRRAAVALACFGHRASLRGTQEIMEAAFGSAHRPALDRLQAEMRWHGLVAQALVETAAASVADKVHSVAADDVYFHRTDVKAIIEPVSNAILDVRISTGPTTAEWTKRLGRFPNLSTLVADMGVDLCAAAKALGLRHQIDYWHEVQIFEDVLEDVSKAEGRQRKYAASLQGLEGWGGGGGRSGFAEAMREARALEEAFYIILAALEMVRSLYEPVERASGRLWTKTRITEELSSMLVRLESHGSVSTRRIARHIRTYSHGYVAHVELFDAISVDLSKDAPWSKATVLQGAVQLRSLERGLRNPGQWTNYAQYLDQQRLARELEKRLRRACLNYEHVRDAVDRECARPRRSSSCVESLNSRLRVMQMVHRNVSDEMLALLAFQWNVSPRKRGHRKGSSPYDLLGVNWGRSDKPWYEVLLEAEAARGLTA